MLKVQKSPLNAKLYVCALHECSALTAS